MTWPTFSSMKIIHIPPSLSDRHRGKKFDLLTCLEQDTSAEPPNSFDVEVLDGAAVVHFPPTENITTFRNMLTMSIPYIEKLLETSNRVDVVWDSINDACKEMFCQKSKAMGNIPPTHDA